MADSPKTASDVIEFAKRAQTSASSASGSPTSSAS